jgi:predicted phage-related endonuclease
MIKKIKWAKAGHEEWLTQRRSVEGFGSLDTVRFGASDIGTIMGSSKWKCKRRLFEHVIGRHTTEWRTMKSVSGHRLEDVVAGYWENWHPNEEEFLFNIERDVKLRQTKKANFFILNSKYPQLFASIDRLHNGETHSPFTGQLYDELTPIELKTTQSAYYKLWNDGITQSYKEQVMAQMMLSETKLAVFCVFISGEKFVAQEIEYDSLLAEEIDYNTKEFQQTCIAGKQLVDLVNCSTSQTEKEEYMAMLEDISPEVSALEDEQVLLKELNPNSLGTILGDESDFKYLVDYQCAQDNIKEFEEVKQRAKNNILSLMKDTEVMEFERGKVTWRRTPDKRDYFAIKLYK